MSEQMNELLESPDALIDDVPIEFSNIEGNDDQMEMEDLKISIKMVKSKTTFD